MMMMMMMRVRTRASRADDFMHATIIAPYPFSSGRLLRLLHLLPLLLPF
jgi:hypothetical protein